MAFLFVATVKTMRQPAGKGQNSNLREIWEPAGLLEECNLLGNAGGMTTEQTPGRWCTPALTWLSLAHHQ